MMNVACRPKSVIRRIAPPAVGWIQILELGPSASGIANQFPSGESTGCGMIQDGRRALEMRSKGVDGPVSGRAFKISRSAVPFTFASSTA